MEQVQLLFGITSLVISVVAFYFALPTNGQVVNFLRHEQLQSYYTIFVIASFMVGSLFTLSGLTTLAPGGAYH